MYITNRIELLGSKKDVDALINMYSSPISRIDYSQLPLNIDDDGAICSNQDEDRSDTIFANKKFGEMSESQIRYKEVKDVYFPDFNKIVPEPEKFQLAFAYDDDFPNDLELPYIKWRMENWGTYQSSFENEKISDREYLFCTSLSSVPELINLMSLAHPNVAIIYEYTSLAIGFDCGRYTFQNGERSRSIFLDGSFEAKEMTYKIIPEFFKGYLSFDGKVHFKV